MAEEEPEVAQPGPAASPGLQGLGTQISDLCLSLQRTSFPKSFCKLPFFIL